MKGYDMIRMSESTLVTYTNKKKVQHAVLLQYAVMFCFALGNMTKQYESGFMKYSHKKNLFYHYFTSLMYHIFLTLFGLSQWCVIPCSAGCFFCPGGHTVSFSHSAGSYKPGHFHLYITPLVTLCTPRNWGLISDMAGAWYQQPTKIEYIHLSASVPQMIKWNVTVHWSAEICDLFF